MSERNKRYFKCTETSNVEGRYLIAGETYVAEPMIEEGWTLIFENGTINFTDELFERTIRAWVDILTEVAE